LIKRLAGSVPCLVPATCFPAVAPPFGSLKPQFPVHPQSVYLTPRNPRSGRATRLNRAMAPLLVIEGADTVISSMGSAKCYCGRSPVQVTIRIGPKRLTVARKGTLIASA